MNWLFYLLEANACLLVFYAFYCVALRRETFYSYNRYYLLATAALAFILPLFKVSVLAPQVVLPVASNPSLFVATQLSKFQTEQTVSSVFTVGNVALLAYLLIAGVFAVKFLLKLHDIVKLIRRNSIESVGGINLIALPGTKASFSFFNYIFIDPGLPGFDTIISHEKAHIRHHHTIDVIFFELLQIVSWFNPFVRL